MEIYKNIQNRRSVRTFNKTPLLEETKDFINNYLQENTGQRGPLNHKINFFEIQVDSKKQLGTYGIIKNPAGYIAGTCENSDQALIDFGYVFEKLILDFNEKNIGTCWMAGTFKRGEFIKNIDVDNLQIMPVVTPIGHFENKRVFENVMRKVIKADHRKAFTELFFQDDFSKTIQEDSGLKLYEALKAVQLAPSGSNKQPWRILVNDSGYHFFLEEIPNYSKPLGFKVQYIDMGIAMYHFESVAKALNNTGAWTTVALDLELPNTNYHYIMTYK